MAREVVKNLVKPQDCYQPAKLKLVHHFIKMFFYLKTKGFERVWHCFTARSSCSLVNSVNRRNPIELCFVCFEAVNVVESGQHL